MCLLAILPQIFVNNGAKDSPGDLARVGPNGDRDYHFTKDNDFYSSSHQ